MSRKLVLILTLTLLVGTLNVAFNVQKAKANGNIHIRADGSVDPPTAPIQRNGDTYVLTANIASDADGIVVERDNIVVDGASYAVQGMGVGISIDIVGRSNVTIKNTTAKEFEYGMRLEWPSSNCTITKNNMLNNSNGIYNYGSNHTVNENIVTGNKWYGIELVDSNNNTISGNNVTNNGLGARALNNAVYHNNFVNNSEQTHFAEVYVYGQRRTAFNVWDYGYPYGGNYWSNYTGVDANGDGIGDTSYVIDENNEDRYPLVSPWAPLEHELVTSITAPLFLRLGSSLPPNATVTNEGLNDEVDVELVLLINNTIVNSATIPLLEAGDSYILSYPWLPTVEGTYNVTAYAHPVSGETSVDNNRKLTFVIVAVSAPPGMIDRSIGDWIKMDYTLTGAPSGTPLPQWLRVEFLSVEGTNATVWVVMHLSDGTEQDATVPVNVAAGGEAFGLSGFVIPVNLTTGDSVYISGYGNVTIAGETTRTYAGASRTVVYASFSQYGTELNYYWDKQTGVMVEASTTSGTMTATGKATETNMWQPQPTGLPIDPPVLYVLIIAVVVIIAAVAFLVIRRKKKSMEAQARETKTHE